MGTSAEISASAMLPASTMGNTENRGVIEA
jgi:hypothetical protein